MKVEINADELNSLIQSNKQMAIKIDELERALQRFDEQKIHDNAIDLSIAMLRQYMSLVFRSIGYKDTNYFDSIRVNMQSDRFIQRYFTVYKEDFEKILDVEIGSTVTDTFKQAFINIKDKKL
jgi:hypothetical protein